MSLTPTQCALCKGQAYRNKWGELLLHTGMFMDERTRDVRVDVCPGSKIGARP